MRNDAERTVSGPHVDWKALGYLTSILSVFFLGAIAWPKPDDPAWHLPALIFGMATSIIGMGFRYKAHLDEKREIGKAKAKADHADGRGGAAPRSEARMKRTQ
jgi:hypothetical protein